MRLLIGIYLILGLAYVALSSVIGLFALQSWLASVSGGRRPGLPWEEGLLVAAVGMVPGLLAWLAAYGLYKRWRLMRLVLLGLSWFYLALCAFVAAVALAMLAGWTDGRALGIDDPPGQTLLLAAGIAAFPALQCWILMRKSVSESFRNRTGGKGRSASVEKEPVVIRESN